MPSPAHHKRWQTPHDALLFVLPVENKCTVELTVEYNQHMKIVQIVLDKQLLQAADQAAKRTRKNRSALVRDALREHLQRLELRAKEERDRQGYSRKAHTREETLAWEAEAVWPQE
jgi:Arc/MetJ-type ribon-helix-helix transcriptional regulator